MQTNAAILRLLLHTAIQLQRSLPLDLWTVVIIHPNINLPNCLVISSKELRELRYLLMLLSFVNTRSFWTTPLVHPKKAQVKEDPV